MKRKNKLKNCGNKGIGREKRIDKKDGERTMIIMNYLMHFDLGVREREVFKVKIKCRNGTVI